MKKSILIIFCIMAAAIWISSCSPVKSHIEVAQGINFSNYKTFAWVNNNGTANRCANDIIDNNIKNDISSELTKKGWTENNQNPDVLLDYNVMVEKKTRQVSEPMYGTAYAPYYFSPWRRHWGYFYNSAYLQGYSVDSIPFKEGTLTVNMIDSKTHRLIWQGSAEQVINNNSITTQQAQAGIRSIFQKMDLPRTS